MTSVYGLEVVCGTFGEIWVAYVPSMLVFLLVGRHSWLGLARHVTD